MSGLVQGLAYKNKGLDFSQIVVAAKNFLAIWRVDDLPEDIRDEVLAATGAPNRIGVQLARRYSAVRNRLLGLAVWNGVELTGTLFQKPELIAAKLRSFEETLRQGRKIRLKVTLKNFTSVLKEMTEFFDPNQPVKTVRAFYSMLYGWTDSATIQLSDKVSHKATLGGEVITDLESHRRREFKDYVENRYIYLAAGESRDDFFARYDEALDAVDRNFRVRHGIFFTDPDLSKFVMWLVKSHVPNLGKNYLVIDPACGSGNLVTNWRSPLELRHKVVSEIEPELLFAVEKRMSGDHWHNGKFTVVPKTSENRGLNFLDKSAEEYLRELRISLDEKGQKPDKPLAFLCNPPYRNDDDQGTEAIAYEVHESIVKQIGMDAKTERYCCFLAQMKLICDAARSSGLPDDSLLLLFTKSAWLTQRPMFQQIRTQMLGAFDNVAGVLVKGKEFFDVKGTWPVAFSLRRYQRKGEQLDATRSIPLLDLTWLTKKQLSQVPWNDPPEMEKSCESILQQAVEVKIGVRRIDIRKWSGQVMTDFKRDRRKDERNAKIVGGLPLNDPRHNLKKAHGATDGLFIGFMDDLTPCRIKRSVPDKPWFYLDNRFMSIRQARCLSGPPTHLGYCADSFDSAKKLFFWYALCKTFLQEPYPLWIDADRLWAPSMPEHMEDLAFQAVISIGYADNECIEARFPANNPMKGLPELRLSNPMTPLNSASFFSTVLRPRIAATPKPYCELITAVDELFAAWKKLVRLKTDLSLSKRSHFGGHFLLTEEAGILQIRDFATENSEEKLLLPLKNLQLQLNAAKKHLFQIISDGNALNYFGSGLTFEPTSVDLNLRQKSLRWAPAPARDRRVG